MSGLSANETDSGFLLPDDLRAAIIELALKRSEQSLRELAARFSAGCGYFVWEASSYRLLKANGPSTSPDYIVMVPFG